MVVAIPVAKRLGFVVIERDVDTFDEGKVGRDVAAGDLDLAVLHVLGMDEHDVVDHLHVLEQNSAHEAIEIAAGDESVLAHEGFLQNVVSRSFDRSGPDLRSGNDGFGVHGRVLTEDVDPF